ncbi:T9SS type A sorting domain-containing protein [Aequorivita todarodis]|uniref:T9SS type A sorting domain-containing protein n=1 Tax=Aequorivita todarodis TaxID=2036821 RepID=UPI002350A2D4|nr:T9SS type A sorting domain-containing protein [Aequorivita todarodis]MDC8002348.1 T9SS type A sorting domain-containing protein [Aequorivita todarodis]
MKHQYTILLLLFPFLILKAQNTYVPDDNFEQRLIVLGLDDVLDNYVITSNISNVFTLDLQNQNISDLTGLEDFSSLVCLDSGNNHFSIIPLHPNVNLSCLTCSNNQLTELDLSQHTNLTELSCANNNITNLDLSQNTSLRYLTCGDNSFPELQLSNHPNLREVRLFGQNTSLENVDIRNGNNTIIQEFAIINSPNLPYIYVDDCGYSTTNWTSIDPTTIFIELEGQTECTLGIEEQTSSDIKFYPNPAKDFLYIDSQFPYDLVSIYSLTGSLIKQSSNSRINVSNLSKGLYFAKISIKGRTITKKFMKL